MTMDELFDGSNAHELCSVCRGTGRVLDGEICRFCEDRVEDAREARMDLVARLRSVGGYFDAAALEHVALAECADEIERLRKLLQQVLTDAHAQDVLLEWWHLLEGETVPNAKIEPGRHRP